MYLKAESNLHLKPYTRVVDRTQTFPIESETVRFMVTCIPLGQHVVEKQREKLTSINV